MTEELDLSFIKKTDIVLEDSFEETKVLACSFTDCDCQDDDGRCDCFSD